MKIEINATTGEVIERELTDAEKTQETKDQAKAAENATKLIEAETAKNLAQAKLTALGLTIADLEALGL